MLHSAQHLPEDLLDAFAGAAVRVAAGRAGQRAQRIGETIGAFIRARLPVECLRERLLKIRDALVAAFVRQPLSLRDGAGMLSHLCPQPPRRILSSSGV